MRSYAGIARNFRFMLVQVKKQLENTCKLLAEPDARYVRAIRGSEGYIDTQKSMIENECFALIQRPENQDEETTAGIRAVNVITSNLERIADFTVNITRQMEHYHDPGILGGYQCQAYINGVLTGIDLIEEALFERDSSLALRICQVEDELDRLYHDDLQKVIASLRESRDVDDLVTTLFVLHYLERMGDALLNVGEAILLAVLGERLKVHQYQVLDDALASTPAIERPLSDVELDSIWGTRSGVRIGKMEDEAEPGRRVLFKEGNPEKLQREHESLNRWNEVAPGLVPEVIEYQRGGKGDALLLQYIDGRTLQDLVLNADGRLVGMAEAKLEATLRMVWSATKTAEPTNRRFLQQLLDRIEDVYRLHPELRTRAASIGSVREPSFNERLEAMLELDTALDAPFSVFIHGDFNLDNIIYNPDRNSLHFVDVQRSRRSDYVQDVSVFLVSAFRLPVFVARTRGTLEKLALRFLKFARGFAQEHNDTTFEARLALGLVRSFATSTRFELDRRFVRDMQQRAVLLLRKLADQGNKNWDSFRVPDSILVY